MMHSRERYKDGRRRPSNGRLRELVLHIAAQCEGDPTFGATKLNKILFYSDFTAYVRLGKAITGHQYQALKQGPAPKRLLPLMKQMVARNEIATKKVAYQGYDQHRAVALRRPDLSGFKPEEVAIVGDVIQKLWGMSATAVSSLSHQFLGWEVAREGEIIPYGTALISRRDPTKAQLRRGQALNDVATRCLAHGRAI